MPTNDPRSNDNWRLEEGGADDDKWLLRESEQTVADPWALQQSEPVDSISSWQPVEYVKEPKRPTSWVLPAIISVALLVTLGYAAYRVLPVLLNRDSEPAATPVVAVVPTVPSSEEATVAATLPPTAVAVTPTTDPLATTPEAPPPPSAPSNLVPQDFAVVNNELGVNARFSPNIDAAIIRILDQGESLFVFSRQGDWLEVFVADTPLTEGQALSGTVGFAAADFFDVSAREITAQLRDEVLAFAGKLPTPTPEPLLPPTPTADAAAPGVAPTSETTATVPADGALTVTVNAIYGVNIRRGPVTEDDNVIRLLDNGTVLPAVGRTADGLWILARLPDAVDGWIAAEFLLPSGDLTTLPVVGSDTILSPSPILTGTGVITTSGIEPPPPYTSLVPADGSPAIIVTVVDGANARTTPALDADVEALVPQGAVLPATGRSTDSQWVEVTLPTGVSAWIFRDTVVPVGAVGALPATDGGLATPTPEATFAPVLLPTLTPTPAPLNAEPPTEATATPEPTAATEATATPEPTATVESTPESTTVTAEVVPFVAPLYGEPSREASTVANVRRGADLVVIGRTTEGGWLQVTTAEGTTGWAMAGNLRLTGDIGTVPVVP
jgi:uncharacterized protein YgiM (DUF1202 family)